MVALHTRSQLVGGNFIPLRIFVLRQDNAAEASAPAPGVNVDPPPRPAPLRLNGPSDDGVSGIKSDADFSDLELLDLETDHVEVEEE